MEKIVSSTELQKRTRDIIDLARSQDTTIVIQTYGKPMAVMLSYDEYQAYLTFKQRQHDDRKERFAALRRMADLQAEAGELLEEAESQALIDGAREQVAEQHAPASQS